MVAPPQLNKVLMAKRIDHHDLFWDWGNGTEWVHTPSVTHHMPSVVWILFITRLFSTPTLTGGEA